MTKRDYYEILSVSRDVDEPTLKSSYRKLALTYHPDRNPNNPDAAEKFREASEALRVVLWQQGRVGIAQGTVGAELSPAVMSRHDRHLLKSTFPVIQRLIEFAASPSWLDTVDVAVDRSL